MIYKKGDKINLYALETTLFFWLQVIFGGHRPPLQVAICKTTLKLQIHAVAAGGDRRK